MTEAEWLACAESRTMLRFAQDKVSDRKLRLFAVACCERVEDLLVDARSRGGLACARRASDGRANHGELAREHDAARAAWCSAVRAVGSQRYGAETFDRMCRTLSTGIHLTDQIAASDAGALAAQAVQAASAPTDTFRDQVIWGAFSAARAASLDTQGIDARMLSEFRTQCDLLRDIFGNPFRPVAINSAWLASTVTVLAGQMYESRDFSRMPILADALQDAGCDNEGILNHCRQPGVHIRGCWAVDVVLGKK